MAAEETGFRKQIQEELTCSICLELFKQPKALPCQHTYCYNCLLDCARRTSPLKCPNCRHVVKLSPEGVEGLPDNHLIANLCETFPKQVVLTPPTSLTSAVQEQAETSCDLHQQHDLSLYCTQCDTPVCLECLDIGHAGHAFTTIRQAVEQRESDIWQIVSDNRQKLDEDSLSLKVLRSKEAEIRSSKEKTEAAVVTFLQDVVKKLEESKDNLLSSINKNFQQNMKSLEACKDVLLVQMGDLSNSCIEVEKAAGKGPADFLQQGNSLRTKMNDYRKVDIPTLEPSPSFEPDFDSSELELGRVKFYDPQEMVQEKAVEATSLVEVGESAADERSRQVTFGGWGLGCGKFQQQAGIAVSKVGQVFVLDSYSVQTFDLQGSFLYGFYTSIPGTNVGVMMPHGIATEGGGDLWIVGTDLRTSDFLVKYSDMGQYLLKIPLPILWYHSRQVAVNHHSGNILVTEYDGNSSKIKMFQPNGYPCAEINLNIKDLQVHGPPHMATDIHGNIFVVDSYKSCIYSFDHSGKLRCKFATWGHGIGYLHLPHSICTDSNGNVIVAEHGNTRLKLFAPDGQYLLDIDTDMEVPWKVAAGPEGQLVVSDATTHLVKILKEY